MAAPGQPKNHSWFREATNVEAEQGHALPGIEDGLREACRNRSTTISSSPAW